MSKRNKNAQSRRNTLLYGLAGVMLLVAALILFARTNTASGHEHPQPRAEAAQMHTESPDRYGDYPEAKEVYKLAAYVKTTLDGLFCYCYCKGGGHYSLLDCFKDDHGAGCDICLDEARLAYGMVQQGASLDQIRAAIDAQFGKS
jgi:hypothetical protein